MLTTVKIMKCLFSMNNCFKKLWKSYEFSLESCVNFYLGFFSNNVGLDNVWKLTRQSKFPDSSLLHMSTQLG